MALLEDDERPARTGAPAGSTAPARRGQ